MLNYHWPGNIRELHNIIERVAVLTPDNIIRLDNLPVIFAELAVHGPTKSAGAPSFQKQRSKQVDQIELSLLKRYLKQTHGNVSAAERLAGIPRRSFYRLLERHGLSGRVFKSESDLTF